MASIHALQVRRGTSGMQWWRGHCDSCAACSAGREAWCESWVGPGSEDRWSAPFGSPTGDPGAVALAATCLDVVRSWEPVVDCLLVLGAGAAGPEVERLLSACDVAAVATDDQESLGQETRRRVAALSGSGRPDVIVTFGPALARCVRWVRRGGAVAAAVTTTEGPLLDLLVMREVIVLGVRRPHARLEELVAG